MYVYTLQDQRIPLKSAPNLTNTKCAQPPCISNELHLNLVSASEFLQSFNRGIKPILGDGNCLFRAFSQLTFGTEDYHSHIRAVLVDFESTNSDIFQSYCTEDITNHLLRIKLQKTWGTHVELQAAACLLELPIYVCTQKSGSGQFYWEVFKPLKTKFTIPKNKIEKPCGIHHYEICHTMRMHYDIITARDGSMPFEPPHIQTEHIYMSV